MIQDLFIREEGKTLEFKENAQSLPGIIKTVVAFANTAGGTIVIGVEDRTKKIVGVVDPLEDEMRIINAISASVMPQLTPNIEIQSYRKKTLILIQVPYAIGPYHFKKEGTSTVYVRFGSTNRIADSDTISNIKALAQNITFDERPCAQAPKDSLDWKGIEKVFAAENKEITKNKARSMGMLTIHSGTDHPTNGGILLFGENRSQFFPDAIVRCVRFAGLTRTHSSDHRDIDQHLPVAIDDILDFITKNTFTATKIGPKKRVNIPQYPDAAIREAVINAIVHTDYSIKGSSIIVAIFDDRIEITNPGGIAYGLSLEDALAGSSRARNRVIARTFHFLGLVEQWGSGLQKIIESCIQNGLSVPKFEEIGSQFRVTIYSTKLEKTTVERWQQSLLEHVHSIGEINTKDAAKFWKIDIRSARRRIKKLVDKRLLIKTGVSKNDPYGKYVVRPDLGKPTK
jgi:predicted HTH transcriptional regulator